METDLPDIQATLKIPSAIRDGLQRFCRSLDYSYVRDSSNLREFCEGIHITGAQFEVVERLPIRRNLENTRNATGHAAQIRERCRQTRDLFRRAAQGITARLRPARYHVEMGGSVDIRNETRDNRSYERNDEHVVPPGVNRTRVEEHFLEIIRYHVTLTAQADRTISVLSTRVLAAGGIGAAGGGLGAVVTGAGVGAATGTLTLFSWVSSFQGEFCTQLYIDGTLDSVLIKEVGVLIPISGVSLL